MYTTRLLPQEEWHKLPVLDARFHDELSNIMVIEHDGEIIANWVLMPIYHAEGLWVKEDYRKNPAVIRRLITGMKAMTEQVNASYIVTVTHDKEVAALLDKFPKSEKLNGDFYLMAFED